MRTRVKICCISSVGEAQTAIEAGADALGLVSDMPSGPGVVSDVLIQSIAARVPPPLATFLLTRRLDLQGVVAHCRTAGCNTVQIVDHVDPAVLVGVRSALPWLRVVQVVHVTGPESIELARDYGRVAHAVLLDSGTPGADFQELGGTGRTHDWELSARIVRETPVPVWLAGGLKPGNVAEAIRTVRPFGVDLCSGVREAGHLDANKLTAFMWAVREEDASR